MLVFLQKMFVCLILVKSTTVTASEPWNRQPERRTHANQAMSKILREQIQQIYSLLFERLATVKVFETHLGYMER